MVGIRTPSTVVRVFSMVLVDFLLDIFPDMLFDVLFDVFLDGLGLLLELAVQVAGGSKRVCQRAHQRHNHDKVLEDAFRLRERVSGTVFVGRASQPSEGRAYLHFRSAPSLGYQAWKHCGKQKLRWKVQRKLRPLRSRA